MNTRAVNNLNNTNRSQQQQQQQQQPQKKQEQQTSQQKQKEWKKKIKIQAISLEFFLTAKLLDSETDKFNNSFAKFNNQIADWVKNGVHLSVLRNLDMKDYFGKDKTVRMDLFDIKTGVSQRVNQEKFANLFYTRMRAARGFAGKSHSSPSSY